MTPSARWTVFLLICVVLGCGRAEPERAPEPLPPPVRPARAPIVVESGDVVLDGSWFVRYRTIATPFLDVAFRGSAQPSKVRVDLRGPEQAFEGIELTWSKEDGEWQHPIKWLPDPLPAGLWWVAVVEAELADGQLLRYSTSHPSKPYSLSRAKAGADSPSTQATTIRPGALTAPATGADLLRIETGP
ncbi:MAG: hypothetical protein VX498_06295, partial [Myxococcota bacterium]|nr:hypothetical protein [Myxococcota bacterium]